MMHKKTREGKSPRGPSSTTWTNFDPILTTYVPLLSGQLLTFYIIPTICFPVFFLLNTYLLRFVHVIIE